MNKLHVAAGHSEYACFDWHYVMSPPVPLDFGETTITLFDAPNVSTAARVELSITIRAEESQHLRAIVAVISLDVIENGLKGFLIPDQWVRVKETGGVVATHR